MGKGAGMVYCYTFQKKIPNLLKYLSIVIMHIVCLIVHGAFSVQLSLCLCFFYVSMFPRKPDFTFSLTFELPQISVFIIVFAIF